MTRFRHLQFHHLERESEVTAQQGRSEWFYEDTNDIARLAACYAASVVQIHPFFDGNKRTGWETANLFAILNGWILACDTDVAAWMMLGYASRQLDEEQLTDLVGKRLYQLA